MKKTKKNKAEKSESSEAKDLEQNNAKEQDQVKADEGTSVSKSNVETADTEPEGEGDSANNADVETVESKEEAEPEAKPEQVATKSAPLDLRVATLIVLVLSALSIMAANTFSDQGILLIAGLFVFLGAYPALKLDIRDATKRFSVEMALLFALCMVIFVVLRFFVPHENNDPLQAEIVIIILSTMATRLIIWPIYNYGEDEN